MSTIKHRNTGIESAGGTSPSSVHRGSDTHTSPSSSSSSSFFHSMFTKHRIRLRTSSIAFLFFISLEILRNTVIQVQNDKSGNKGHLVDSQIQIMEQSKRSTFDGLRAIVTGFEHSGTTLIGSLLFNAPCVIGAHETGYLVSDSPMQINDAKPWFDWNVQKLRPMGYRLLPSDIKAMKNTTNFFDMYQVLRQRSYLFNDLNDEEHCPKPAEMIDKTPRYVYPKYFERVLKRTPGVPVIVTQKGFDKLRDSWRRRKGNMTQEFYNETFDNVNKMMKKYPNRILIIHEEDLMDHPDEVMTDVFHHVGLKWRTEYLQMEGLLKKFANDTESTKWIQQWKFTAGKHSPS